MFFLLLDWGCGFWEECREVKYHPYHKRGCGFPHEIAGDLNLAHLGKVAFARFLFCKVIFFPFPYSVS